RIQLRINGPLTHTSIEDHFQVTATSDGITASSTPTDITMAGAIYKSGGGTGPVDDTIIYDEDVSATLTPGTDAVTYVNAAITEALQAETAAHGVAEQYLIWVTATTSTGDSFYPILIGSGGRAAWQNNDYEHHNWIDTSGTVSGVVLGSSLTGYGQTPVALGFASDTGTSSLTVSHIKIQVVRGETPPAPTTYTGTVNVTVNGTAAAIESAQSGATRLALSADNGSTYVDMTSSATGVYTATGLTQGSSYSVYWYNGTYHKLNGYTVSSATPVTVPYFTVTLRTGTGVTALSIDGTAVANGTPRTYLSGTGIQLNATVDTAHGYTWRDWANTAGGATRWLTRNTLVTVSEPLDLTARADYQAAVIVRKNGTPGSIVDIYASATGLKLRNTADASDVRTLTYNGDNKTYTCEGLTPGSQYQVMWEYDASTLTRIGDFVILDGTVLTIDYYTVTLTGDAGVASMTVNGEAATSGTAYTYLAGTVSINATAGSGYTWLGWYDTANDSLYQANASVPNITLNGALALTAKTEAEGSGGGPTLLSEWHANLGGVDGKPSYLHGRYGSLTINQYSYDAGYLTSAPGTNVTWPQFLAAHGSLAADEYIVLTYENAGGLGLTAGTDPAAITALTNFGYTGVTNASIASAEITPTKIRLRINGPLTVAAAANMSLTVSGCSLNNVEVTNGTFMTGQIYREGSGSSEPDDTVIFDQDVTATVSAPGHWNYQAIREAFAAETAAHGIAEKYIVTITASANPGEYIYPVLFGAGNSPEVWPDGTVEHNYRLKPANTVGTISATIPGTVFAGAGKGPDHFYFGTEEGATTLTITHVKIEVVRTVVDDTIIFDQDVTATVNSNTHWNYQAIREALAAETSANGVAAQYLVTGTASANPGRSEIYPVLFGTGNAPEVWPAGDSDQYSLTPANTVGNLVATISGTNLTAAGKTPDHLYFYADGATTLTITHVKIQVVRN
ncbi:MAG: hypothetical protein IKI63_05470, partial [Clostridia bacterium]|nr:hypothetical protein [Clostridia bacterium]